MNKLLYIFLFSTLTVVAGADALANCTNFGILSTATCGYNVIPGFAIFIIILSFGVAYVKTHRLTVGFEYSGIAALISLALSPTGIFLVIATTLCSIAILSFMYEHKMHNPHEPRSPQSLLK